MLELACALNLSAFVCITSFADRLWSLTREAFKEVRVFCMRGDSVFSLLHLDRRSDLWGTHVIAITNRALVD